MSSSSSSGHDDRLDENDSPPPKRQRLSVDPGPASGVAPVLDDGQASRVRRSWRQATLYDAVAKNVTISGFAAAHDRTAQTPSTRDTTNRSSLALPPADVLFKRTAAPPRYEEPQLDPYGAHRWLPSRTATLDDDDVRNAYPTAETLRQLRLQNEDQGLRNDLQINGVGGLGGGGRGLPKSSLQDSETRMPTGRRRPPPLPDSDLLKALHAYASAFYARTSHDRGASDWRSMDETALLAMGMLIEEAAKEVVVGGGWRALVEGRYEQDVARRGRDGSRSVIAESGRRKRKVRPTVGQRKASTSEDTDATSAGTRNVDMSEAEHDTSVAGTDDY